MANCRSQIVQCNLQTVKTNKESLHSEAFLTGGVQQQHPLQGDITISLVARSKSLMTATDYI